MAGRALTPAGVILKWILIPVALLAIGFFLIGSKIGRILPGVGGNGGDIHVTPVADNNSPNYSAPDVEVHAAQSIVPPEVQISARKKSRHHRHAQIAPSDVNAKEPAQDYALDAKAPEKKPMGPGT